MTDIEQAARAEAWTNFYRAGMGQRESEAFQAAWDARGQHLLSDESAEQMAREFAIAVHGDSADQQDADYYEKPLRAALSAVLGTNQPNKE